MTVAVETDFVRETLAAVQPTWLHGIRQQAAACERRRAQAVRDTGTVSEAAALYLRALTERLQPKVAVEFGTFIGTSTLAIKADRIYTCDSRNDCGPQEKRIRCHPFMHGTRMLQLMLGQQLQGKVDFFFFDGRIENDVPMILALSHRKTVYAFDDYEGQEKGVANVETLAPSLPRHQLILPPTDVCGLASKTTIAVLLP